VPGKQVLDQIKINLLSMKIHLN